jgi:hypothetical protein
MKSLYIKAYLLLNYQLAFSTLKLHGKGLEVGKFIVVTKGKKRFSV